MKIFKKKSKDLKQDEMYICEGISINNSIYSVKDNRWSMFVLKGFMNYLFCAGSVCGLLSASGTKHAPIIINICIFLVAMYLSFIYYNKKIENRGNILFLIIIMFLGFGFSLYINTGFYAILNDVNEKAKEFFDYTGIRTYAEPMNNRYLAVNIAAISIGILCCFLQNMWLRKMMYLDSILLVMIFLIYPSYVEREPDLIYVIMVMCSAAMAYVLKKSGHYENMTGKEVYSLYQCKHKKSRKEKKQQKIKKEVKEKKGLKENNKVKGITYNYNSKVYLSVGVQIFILVFIIVLIMQLVIPKKTYYDKNYETTLKADTKEEVGTFVRQGFAGLFNFYENIAGIADGKLGGVGLD